MVISKLKREGLHSVDDNQIECTDNKQIFNVF